MKRALTTTIAILTLLLTAFTTTGSQTPALADTRFSATELKPLIGRWLRPDGGYILEIRSFEKDGKLDAYYFNPRSINVHRAGASRDNAGIKLVVELRDAGYPGSTYALLYKPDQDILVGYYYQAGRKQYYEVAFVRKSGP